MSRSLVLFLCLAACEPQAPPATTTYTDTDVDTDTDTDVDTDTDTDTPQPQLRVVSWNVETLGSAGSAEYQAVLDVLERLDPDVVGFNELDSDDLDDLQSLADTLGFEAVYVPSSNPFGSIRNGMLSRYPVKSSEQWTSATLSGDPAANDQTRLPVQMIVEPPGAEAVTVIVQHWKSGYYTEDEFRRAIDALRVAQAAALAQTDRVVVMGDVNAELDEGDESPSLFTSIPSGTPGDYWLGSDLYSQLSGAGITSNAFTPLLDLGFTPVDALQLDSRDATREASGRRLDYFFVSQGLVNAGAHAQVYDSKDDGKGGMPMAGSALPRATTATASDHFPILLDFDL